MIVDIHLTRAQQNRLRKGLAIRVGANALTGATQLAVTEAMAKRIESSRRRGKGLQIKASDILPDDEADEEMMMGGKIRIGKAFKKIGNSVSRGFNKTTGTIRKEANRDVKVLRRETPGALKQASHETGRFVQNAKKYVPKDLVAIPLEAGATLGVTMATGNPVAGLAAGRASRSLVESLYETDLSRGSVGKNLARNFGKNLILGEMRNAVKGYSQPAPVPARASYADVPMAQAVPVGSGIRPLGGRLVKGSPEARAYMQAIRNKKSVGKYTGVGLNVTKTVQHHVRDIEGRMRSNPNNISLTMAGDDMGGDFLTRRFKGSGFLPL